MHKYAPSINTQTHTHTQQGHLIFKKRWCKCVEILQEGNKRWTLILSCCDETTHAISWCSHGITQLHSNDSHCKITFILVIESNREIWILLNRNCHYYFTWCIFCSLTFCPSFTPVCIREQINFIYCIKCFYLIWTIFNLNHLLNKWFSVQVVRADFETLLYFHYKCKTD